MWFKNLQTFGFIESFAFDPDSLSEQLAQEAFVPCTATAAASLGWVAPLQQEGAPLVHAGNGYMLMCLNIEEKILPATVVREEVNKKVHDIEEAEGRKVYKKERDTLKAEMHEQLLMRAFSKMARLYGYIDTKNQCLIVDTASKNKAELFATQLRKTLGSLKIQLPQVGTPSTIMTDWLKNDAVVSDIAIDDYCVFEDTQEQPGTIKFQHQDLSNEHITALLDAGNRVTQLGLSWANQVGFILKDDFSITRLRFLDLVTEKVNDSFTETAAERFDADFIIMTETVSQLLNAIFTVFKTEEVQQEEAIPA